MQNLMMKAGVASACCQEVPEKTGRLPSYYSGCLEKKKKKKDY